MSRSYVVGLPVVIDIDDDGRVTFDLDLTEAPTSLPDDEEAAERYSDHETLADIARVSQAVDRLEGHARIEADQ